MVKPGHAPSNTIKPSKTHETKKDPLPDFISREREVFFNEFLHLKPLTSQHLFRLGMEGVERNKAKNGLDRFSGGYLAILKNMQLKSHNLLSHSVRVALNVEYAEIMVDGNPSGAFYSGLLHDIGKITCTNQAWFTDENLPIDDKAFKEIKGHALKGFEILSSQDYLFVGMIAGTHHLLRSENPYGINPMEAVVRFSSIPEITLRMKDIPNIESFIQDVVDASALIEIADVVDAALSRERPKGRGDLYQRLTKMMPTRINRILRILCSPWNILFYRFDRWLEEIKHVLNNSALRGYVERQYPWIPHDVTFAEDHLKQ
ncbi:HD domain-containing protein [Candidatus Micrarchaeota archaeon]|nr:HD domain-containing protein [Candidatus Micrarchaeota archaeon]